MPVAATHLPLHFRNGPRLREARQSGFADRCAIPGYVALHMTFCMIPFLLSASNRRAGSPGHVSASPSPRVGQDHDGLPAASTACRQLLRTCLGVCLIACGCLAADEAPSPQAAARAIRDGVNFRQPARSYVTLPSTWHLHVEKSLVEHQPERARSAVAKLEAALALVFKSLPDRPAATLASLDIYLLWGKNSPEGGRDSGMSYVRKGEPDRHPHLDPRWEHAVIIYSADNLLHLDDLWTHKALMHELAHAWHLSQWPEKHPPILDAWRHSQDQKRYQNVRDTKGRTLGVAYACKNQLEYFAELSAIYFVGGNYQPFDRQGLQTYDPVGYAMIEQAWGLTK